MKKGGTPQCLLNQHDGDLIRNAAINVFAVSSYLLFIVPLPSSLDVSAIL